MQASDVSWNKPFKSCMIDLCNTWMVCYNSLQKKEIRSSGLNSEVVINSFKPCGLNLAALRMNQRMETSIV